MVEIHTPLSLWMQLGSCCFILAGVHGDLLAIRFFLFCAYVLLFTNACLGAPLWPDLTNKPGEVIVLDALFWTTLGLWVHGGSLFSLIWDEKPVELGDREAALWRMCYRTGGLSARLYKNVVSPYVEVVEFHQGDDIPTEEHFYIVYRGLVHLKVFDGYSNDVVVEKRVVSSGDMFDLKHVGMFHQDSIFVTHRIECACMSEDTVLFRIHKKDMEKIAKHRFAKSVWQALLISSLSYAVETYVKQTKDFRRHPNGGIDKIFQPLQDWEMPAAGEPGSGTVWATPFRHLIRSIFKSFSPPRPFGQHPSGIRQTLLSPPGPKPSVSYQNPSRQPFSFLTSLHGRWTGRSSSYLDEPQSEDNGFEIKESKQ